MALVDRGGRVAVHTGMRCIEHAGHALGEQVSAQANMMERDTVPRAMIRRLLGVERPAARRAAARRARGGRGRGRRHTRPAVGGHGRGRGPRDRQPDAGPARRPARGRPRATRSASSGGCSACSAPTRARARATTSPAPATSRARSSSTRRRTSAQPDNLELAFWYGLALAGNGREEEAVRVLRAPFQAHPGWVELLKRLPAAGLIPDDAELIARLAGTRAVSEPRRSRRHSDVPRPRAHPRARRCRRQRRRSRSGARRTCRKGGPDGGDGGRGGDVVIVVDPSLRDLSGFRRGAHFKAKRGGHGEGANRHGATPDVARGARAAGHGRRGPRARATAGTS